MRRRLGRERLIRSNQHASLRQSGRRIKTTTIRSSEPYRPVTSDARLGAYGPMVTAI
jgi:hypothetical protein